MRVRLPAVVLGLSVLVFLAAGAGLALGLEPFVSWYYCFAWWPYIFAVESLLALRGAGSDLYDHPRDWLLLLPLSVTLWLFFEAVNFRLGNWQYVNLPADAPERWAGYVLSFATVLPGLFATARLLEFFGLFARAACPPLKEARRLHLPLAFTGAVFLLLPLLLPRYFFPLIWGALVPLLEPWVHGNGGRSLLGDWEQGAPRRFLLLLAAGLVCGGLWELWNFQAGAKWIYTVPFVGDAKIFEMPVLGFLGFPPFAVECYVAANAFLLVRERAADLSAGARRIFWSGVVVAALVFDALVMAGIDRITVISFR
ncbi:hypothetical protein [Paucidesulfovibrio longus]|uniref:hypothetical protein n=1 Tax=Paucidesulfovibrio longus TaxID=889 RepID=UPI0012DC59EA|nr:hypothetical protein [Paucidesulfovibrio longus]